MSISRSVVRRVDRARRIREGEIQVTGSGELIQALMRHDLVDEYRLMVFPVLLGGGKRLFGGGTMPAALELAERAMSGTGVAIHTYRRAGELQQGSFALDE